jgi:hypothetical protein
MKTLFKVLLLLVLVGSVSCEKEEGPVIDDSNLLLGYWMNPAVNDTIFGYDRVAGFKKDAYGFAFKEGNVFVERKSEGWCGTPPVVLKDFEGTWTRNDSVIDIHISYWGGMSHYQWKIVTLDVHSLVVVVRKQDFEE